MLNINVPEELHELKETLMHEGYMSLRVIDGKLCGLRDYMTTRAIVIGLTEIELERRYCFQNRIEADEAFAAYTDTDKHPTGNWIKVKGTYRGQHIDDFNPEWK